ncbi:FKBP-type peptidyl-prolyl cis-trans isomerase [Mucilaginibacter sp. L196]|uniref:FKBP-type peptidyl-prolyl cis-trans isomerase n=1 Tax=Mucilaginibacter sp. L196 TaxID=1641870 RepID=UPI00131C98D3|nr:FKBP-type peptidyl-prolyl cis-trans isomerase [Mucilaginibacter sp. L196]
MKRILLLSGLLIILFSACKKQTFNDTRQATIDELKIQAYIKANNIDSLTKDPSGLYYRIVTQNPGAHPTVTDTVQVSYVGKLLNGTVFDTETATVLGMPGLIKGWQIGIPMLGADHINKAARIRLIIPSALAYADSGSTAGAVTIPPNAVLDFTIDLIGFYQ